MNAKNVLTVPVTKLTAPPAISALCVQNLFATVVRAAQSVRITSVRNALKNVKTAPMISSVRNAIPAGTVWEGKATTAKPAAYVRTVWKRSAQTAAPALNVPPSVLSVLKPAVTAHMKQSAAAVMSAKNVPVVRAISVIAVKPAKTVRNISALAATAAQNAPLSVQAAAKNVRTAPMTSFAVIARPALTVSAVRATTVRNAACVNTVWKLFALAAMDVQNAL